MDDLLARHKERLERTNRLFGLSEDKELLLALIEAYDRQEERFKELVQLLNDHMRIDHK